MKVHLHIQAKNTNRIKFKNSAGLALLSLLALASPLIAADFSVSGESTTILRMRTTTDDKNLYPVYEYLRLGMANKLADNSTVAFHVGAWGRLDLADRSTDRYTDKDLQYAFLSYRAVQNNAVLNLGRQFISEGVASEKIDGLYLRHDFIAGLSASAFAGSPVLTETSNTGANLVYGLRISHSLPKYYTIGFSALKNEATGSTQYREEQGFDLWLHPEEQLDITGRSSYNSITNDWMEHAYVLTLSPADKLKISGNVSCINYKDYFHNVTTRVFDTPGFRAGEKLVATGIGLSYSFPKDINFTADYKNYNYKHAVSADYYGGKLTVALPGAVAAGMSIHRMEGAENRLQYNEYRLYALKKMGHIDINADIFNVRYDKPVNGIRNSFAVTGSAGYEINEKMRVGADVEFARNPEYNREMRALAKFVYAFDTKRSEGRDKSEK